MRSKILMDTINMYMVILICYILIIIQNTNYGIGRGTVSFFLFTNHIKTISLDLFFNAINSNMAPTGTNMGLLRLTHKAYPT